MAEIILLNRIRVDIGNVSGSLLELMKYAGMAGFNDNYEPQAKPRLVGTWTINDWYTPAQLAQAQSAFDGLTIVGDPNYVIDFSQMAVQVLDDTQSNYNPAAAIILQGQNQGVTLDNPIISGGGRWFLTKTAAAVITSISTWFSNKTTVTDTNGIVSTDTSLTYDFDSFIELKYFNNLTSLLDSFYNCSKLKYVMLPNTVTQLNGGNGGDGVFANCSNLLNVNIPNDLQILGNFCFTNCTSLNIGLTFPNTITNFRAVCFTSAPLLYIHITNTTPFTISIGDYGSFKSISCKIYVGDGSSAANDNAILQAYLADTNWATYASNLDTWYNYLHPTI